MALAVGKFNAQQRLKLFVDLLDNELGC